MSDDRIVVGVYWLRDDGSQGVPVVFQSVRVRDGRIAVIHEYASKERALRGRFHR